MKEFTIEEKAKAYDEAKLRMSAAYNSNRCTIGFMNEIFPELKESEDERIRKVLIQNLKERFGTEGNMGEGLDMPDVLAWLEAQGEQKSDEWSEEDEKKLSNAIIQLKAASNIIVNDEVDYSIAFIKSLKERIQLKVEHKFTNK